MYGSRVIERYAPLIVVLAFSVAIKALDPIRSPVIGALDPWGWTALTREFLATGELGGMFAQSGYPPTFVYLLAGIAKLVSRDPYDVVRYIPVATALTVIPIYLLTFTIFRSHGISASASLLTYTARYYFIRTSIGIPEGLAHLFLDFTLLFILLALMNTNRAYNVLAAVFMAASFLYYHFVFLILIPFLLALIITSGSRAKQTTKKLAFVSVPALLFSGVVWYFWVLSQMVQHHVVLRDYVNQPAFHRTLIGYLYALAYAVGKSGAVTLAYFGYAITLLSLAGFILVLVRRREEKKFKSELFFLLTYLATLIVLELSFRILYALTAFYVAEVAAVYMYSWLTLPAAMLASYALFQGLERMGQRLSTLRISAKQVVRLTKVSLLILLVLANLSALNYYKVSTGGGLGILQAHYTPKVMTDDEYYALDYIRSNTAKDSVVLVVGVEEQIVTYEAIVAGRTIVSMRNVTLVGTTLIFDGLTVSPSLQSLNLTRAQIKLYTQSEQQIYLITGIKRVNLDMIGSNGPPPLATTLMENVVISAVTTSSQYNHLYQNDQVTVLEVSAILEV